MNAAHQQQQPLLLSRYKTNLRSFDKFNIKLQRNTDILNDPPTTAGEINRYVTNLENAIIKTTENILKKTVNRDKTVPWWTPTLTKLRQSVHMVRNLFQRSSDEYRESMRLRYISTKREYVRSIRREKRESWRKYVATQFTRNPWWIIHKMCTSKLTPAQASTAVCSGTATATNWRESVHYLLDTLIIDDNMDDDTSEQRRIREGVYPIIGIVDTPSFTEEEVSDQLSYLRRNKSPGLDNIDTNLIQGEWPILHTSTQNLLIRVCLPKRSRAGGSTGE